MLCKSNTVWLKVYFYKQPLHAEHQNNNTILHFNLVIFFFLIFFTLLEKSVELFLYDKITKFQRVQDGFLFCLINDEVFF